MGKVKRLFDQFKPEHYVLDLVPNKKNMTFTGTVKLTGKKTGPPSRRITLHQKALKIHSATVVHMTKKGQKDIHVDRINLQKSFDEVRLHTSDALIAGNYEITVSFSGTITRAMNGVYPCFFKHDGKNKQLIATQFESHHAREVFPCIDEPAAKATFDLTLTTPKDEVVISNTPVLSVKKDGSNTITTFEQTPIMSTYLLAFVFGDMKYLESKTKRGVVVRTYATPDNVEYTAFALDVAVKCLDYYSEYFDIDYPLAKCDMIALPDFASGAMENWGCITYREQALLVDPKNTSLPTKQYVAMVVAHELTHQWFGNLVTMEWWTDLWLNEGFATWFEYLAVDHLFPEWEMWTQFAVDEQQQALKLDALKHTHPIEVPVRHPDEIRTIFDAISYSKGASVIHMLYHYLGAKDFQKGLQNYLKDHSYKNTQTKDLWKSLEQASSKPVSTFMDAWTSQSGYPLVQVSQKNSTLKIRQSRFFMHQSDKVSDRTLWPIPLLSQSDDLPDALNTKESSLSIKNPQDIRLNVGGSGFYRTIYDSHILENIAKKIADNALDPLDRLSVLADFTEASKASCMPATDVMDFLKNYNQESNNAVWDVIAGLLGSIRAVMNDESIREGMKPYVRKLVDKELQRLGWEPKTKETYFDSLLRPTILSLAAVSDHESVVNHCIELFEGISTKNNTISPDIRGLVYVTAARRGGKAEFKKLLEMHNASTSSEERLNLCSALCSFEQPDLYNKALQLITTDAVRLQDVAYWLVYSFSNRFSRADTWTWMKENWQWLEKNIGDDLSFYRMPIFAARSSSDSAFLKEYKSFFSTVLSPAFERSYNQGIEIIQWQSEWKKRDLAGLQKYFS
jgi:aminopeptidase N